MRTRQRIIRQIGSVLLLFSVFIYLSACGKQSDFRGSEEKTPAKSGDAVTKIGLVLAVGGKQDSSLNQLAWEGIHGAAEELGVEAEYVESETESDYGKNINALMLEGCDLIVAADYQLADAVRTAAAANPHQKFAVMDDESCGELENVFCVNFRHEEAAYLVGLVAGAMTRSDVVGIVMGKATKNRNRYGYGFCAGVRDANPNARILQMNADGHSDSRIGSEYAMSMIDDGADVIFHTAGVLGKGVVEVCSSRGVYAVGAEVDQSSLAPETVLASGVDQVYAAVYPMMEQLKEGRFQGGVVSFGIAEGGVDIITTGSLLTDELQDILEDARQRIQQGELVVPAQQRSFEAAYGDIYEMD